LIVAIGIAVACSAACQNAPQSRAETTTPFAQQLPQVPVDTARARLNGEVIATRQSAIVDAAAAASPSVVSVNVIKREKTVRRSAFAWWGIPEEYEVQGVGSGFVIPNGLVITNQHVTEGAVQIVVTTNDGTDYPGELLGEDPLTDIAVLRVKDVKAPAVRIGSSRSLQIGEWVVAIGNPYSYLLGNSEPTVTAGVVSAVGRNLLPSSDQPGIYVGMIQTDAAINPGNSGGPLVNVLGEVVGVNSSILSASGGSVGIGFAIPIERAVRVTQELLQYGTVRRAWVGITVAGSANLRDWKKTGGVTVTQVAEDSPAAHGGIRPNDILTTANGRPLRTFLDWEAVKLDVGPGDSLVAVTKRNDQVRRVHLAVEPLPTLRAERVSVLDIEFIAVTPQIQQERRLLYDFGAYIFNIGDRESRITHLQAGDVILQVNQRKIIDVSDLEDTFRRAAGGVYLRVFFERDGQILQTDFAVR
jgi:serine protease Do